MSAAGWQFWIDRGGTFTDIVARSPDGSLRIRKLLSENPDQYADAAVEGIRRILALERDSPIPSAAIAAVKMGTTVATNALLERRGERVVLAITSGFADALRIGYQNRPRLFDRHIVLPELLYERVIEVDERVTAEGEILVPIELDGPRSQLQRAFEDGIRAVAVVFVHGYRYPQHERALAQLAREIGFTQVSVSHEVSPLVKLVGRGDTTVIDAYLSPVLRKYVDQVAAELGEGVRLLFMQSNGGLVEARRFHGKDAILSGPAGGIVGMVHTAIQAGAQTIIGFDMGGTSTDVSHYAGELERTFETVVAGVRIRAPMMHIHTVAAGGGSICRFDGIRLRVGPQSAGAIPGPACYRRGGPLTVTDCNVMLGKLQAEFFPHVFGPAGDAPIDAATVERQFGTMAAEVARTTGLRRSAPELAQGFLHIAVENMANAIKQISIQRGHDVTAYTLACFGGAGGQHACLVADALGMRRILIHRLAGVLSAYGMGIADLRVLKQRAVEAPLEDAQSAHLQRILAELEREGVAEMEAQGIAPSQITVLHRLHLKYEGTDMALIIPFAATAAATEAFAAAHRMRFGFDVPGRPLIIEAASVEVVGGGAAQREDEREDKRRRMSAPVAPASALAKRPVWFGGHAVETPIYSRDDLEPGQVIDAPAIIIEASATTVVEPGWRASVDRLENLILERVESAPKRVAIGTNADPVMLEVFGNLYMSIAEQMGVALQSTSRSVNIKERLDYSCAVFDARGALIANAPHMPIHLGSMGESVKVIIAARDRAVDGRGMIPGDVYALNAPYNGGTHLPDITVIMPVFGTDPKPATTGAEPLFYVASRGHHADIGGITPGSMPPGSRTISEEGVLIDNFLMVDAGRFREEETLALLRGGAYPSRNPEQNLADLKAQVAACAKGAEELRRMVRHFGLEVVNAYMQHVQDHAAEAVRRVLDLLQDGEFAYEMDDGSIVRVRITIDRAARRARIDFSGTSAQRPNNFNAPPAISRAAVLYVFRTLVDDDIPMNDGCLVPLEIVIPEGSMLRPRYPAAVVAGNVETSQTIIDALYGALGVLAGAQGTMNNFTFGDGDHQYYETVCGGSGAGPDFDGTDAVQTHATNSLLTDPEVLEWRFPVLLERFAIRKGSGGQGRHHGGNGAVRQIRFRRAMTAAILSNRRRVPPFGLAGGSPGQVGRNWIRRASGAIESVAATEAVAMEADDVFVIETPGGGGFGAPE
ncbi:MAG TPA: hydantoinase B/oxoprolinase family protein [Steroidobacteraceae bacterium]|nr:hydantoinase B/oxoprolinase family protein [Steroidobacteraceae bacterium]